MSRPYYLVGGSESQLPVDVSLIQKRFVNRIQYYLTASARNGQEPDNVVWVGLNEVQDGLRNLVSVARSQLKDPFFVSLSGLYYPDADAEVSCNRVVDRKGVSIGLAERPGSLPLELQISQVMTEAGNRPIVVIDDTLFHGQTIGLLKSLGLRVDAAVEYFADMSTIEAFAEKGTPVFSKLSLDQYVDVMPLHDFLPCLPLCGKVVGFEDGDGVLKHLGYDKGMSFCIPYIMPYLSAAQVTKWASIPFDFAADFSAFAIGEMIKIAYLIEPLGFETMAQILKQPMRTSWPYIDGDFLDERATIVDIIRRGFLHSMA